MSEVGIIGLGVVRGRGDMSHAELLFKATRAAYDDAGIERKDVTSGVTTSYDYVEGRVLSNQFTLDSIGGTMKPCDLRLGDTGLHGLIAGAAEALAAPGSMVVVGSVLLARSEQSDGTRDGVEEISYEPLFLRPIVAGARYPEAFMFGLSARAYLARYGIAEEELATLVSAESRRGGSKPRGRDEILGSAVVAGPIRELHLAPELDVAAALILTADAPARQRRASLRGLGWAAVGAMPGDRNLYEQEATSIAAQQAYERAGIAGPDSAMRVEVANPYGIDEVLACEALGVAPPGEALTILGDEGGARVNPSGGAQGVGWARGTSSLAQLVDAVTELRESQADGRMLVCQTWGGFAGSTSAVAVLEVGS